MQIIRIKNITASPLPLKNLTVENQVLLPDVEVEITQCNKIYEIQADPQLQSYIANGQCILNDGTRDLTQEESANVAAPVVSTASIYNFNEAPEKLELAANDLLLAEDSEDNFRKKKIKATNIVFLGEGTIVYTPQRIMETGQVYTSSTDPIPLYGMEKEITETGNYEVDFSGQFICLKGWDVVNIALYLDDEVVPDTHRKVEAESYVAVQTGALLSNVLQNQVIRIQWWTEHGKKIIAEARSMKVSRYV